MDEPSLWHKRHALLLASQLPENHADAGMVVAALAELVETFLREGAEIAPLLASNVLTFPTG